MAYTNALYYCDPINGSDTARTALTTCTASNPSGSITRINKTAHGLLTGAIVDLTLFTAWLNAAWKITVVDANNFDLDEAVWQATADASGTVTPRGGSSKADAWKTHNRTVAANVKAGDTVRVIASPDPTLVGTASWTDGSKDVTLPSSVTSSIDNGEFPWTGSANTTVTADSALTVKEGGRAFKCVFAGGFTTGKAAYYPRVDESADVGAHRYWRVYIANVVSAAGYPAFSEIELRASFGGADETGSGTAAADSVFASPTYTADKAVDNNTATLWHHLTNSVPAWWSYDFGAGVTKNITEISLTPRTDGFYNRDTPTIFAVQYSDDNTNWTTSWWVSATWPSAAAQVFSKPTSSTANLDLSAYQQVSFWMYSNTGFAAGTFSLKLCSDAAGATAVNTIAVPALEANVWRPVTVDTGAALGSSILSVALYCDADPGTATVYLDNILACKASSADDALTHQSLIGKVHNLSWAASTTYAANTIRKPTQPNRNGYCYKVTAGGGGNSGSTEPTWPANLGSTVVDGALTWTCTALEETWYPIQSINGTALKIDGHCNGGTTTSAGYSGTTESVPTYKREPLLPTPTSASATTSYLGNLGGNGTEASPITITGGWDRTNMTSQSGETWISGRGHGGSIINGTGIIFTHAYNLSGVRMNYGVHYATLATRYMKYFNCHFHGMNGHGLSFGDGPAHVQGVRCDNGAGQGMNCGVGNVITGGAISLNGNQTSPYGQLSLPMSGLRIRDLHCRWGSTYALSDLGSTNPSTDNEIVGFVSNNHGSYTLNLNAPIYGLTLIKPVLTDANVTGGIPATQAALSELVMHAFGGDATDNRVYIAGGSIRSVTDVRHTASGVAWKFLPTSNSSFNPVTAQRPLQLSIAKVAVSANNLVSVQIWTRRDSTNVKGRLFVRGGRVAGIPNDLSVACEPTINTWVQSSAMTFTPTEDGVVEIFFEAWDGVTTDKQFWIDDLSVVS